MTREVAHFKMFEAALDSIEPNFPPGNLQGDPRYTHTYFNLSNGDGENARGPWNEGQGPWEEGEHWEYIEAPYAHVMATQGLTEQPIKGTKRTPEEAEALGRKLGQQRSQEVKAAVSENSNQWSTYPKDQKTNSKPAKG
jgi:Mn-containing catalase